MTRAIDEARQIFARLGLAGLRLYPRGGMLEVRRADRKLTCLLPADEMLRRLKSVPSGAHPDLVWYVLANGPINPAPGVEDEAAPVKEGGR